jgi:glycosyltransferase involved in cell wall biosynthesis
MCTKNGEKWLNKQIESIFNQKGVLVKLFVLDDFSTDGTVELLHRWQDKFPEIEVHLNVGPRLGAEAAYFNILSKSYESEYVALCDQDDIWLDDHLLSSIENISDLNYGVSCSPRIFIDSDDKITSSGVPTLGNLSLSNALIENVVFGNTIVMNRNFQQLIRYFIPRKAVMHDSWIYLVGSYLNCIRMKKDPTVLYRIHLENVVGKRKKVSIRAIIISVSAYYNQAVEFVKICNALNLEPPLNAKIFSSIMDEDRLIKLLKVIFSRGIVRQKLSEDIIFKLVLTYLVFTKKRLTDHLP